MCIIKAACESWTILKAYSADADPVKQNMSSSMDMPQANYILHNLITIGDLCFVQFFVFFFF